MASVNSDLNDLHRGMKSALSARWRLLMFEGVALIVLGVLAIRLIPLILGSSTCSGWGVAGDLIFAGAFAPDDVPIARWRVVGGGGRAWFRRRRAG